MRLGLKAALAVVFALSLTLVIGAQQGGVKPVAISPFGVSGPATSGPTAAGGATTQTPVTLIGVMTSPAPINNADLLWVDQPSGRLFVADRTNKSIDIFDAVHSVFITRVTGLFGVVNAAAGVTSQGPNGVIVTPDNKIWIGDGMATVRVADLNLAVPAVIQSIPVGPATDGRADELGYDPVDHVVAVGFDAATPPYVAIIDSNTYQVLTKIQFPDAVGMEGVEWDTQLHRFLVNVPANPASYVAVIDPIALTVTKKLTEPNCSGGVNGMALGPFQRLFVYGCGRGFIMNPIDGHVISDSLTQIGTGADQIWYNAGDGRFYLTALDTSTRVQSLIAVDAETNAWVQSLPAVGARNVTAYEGNNHIFTGVRPVAGVTDVCTPFGVSGCIAVFAHAGGQ